MVLFSPQPVSMGTSSYSLSEAKSFVSQEPSLIMLMVGFPAKCRQLPNPAFFCGWCSVGPSTVINQTDVFHLVKYVCFQKIIDKQWSLSFTLPLLRINYMTDQLSVWGVYKSRPSLKQVMVNTLWCYTFIFPLFFTSLGTQIRFSRANRSTTKYIFI